MKRNIYQTATLVTALSSIERTLGFLYRIALSRLIGAEGLGLYQVALSIFSIFVTIGTGGIPITVSRLISKSRSYNSSHDENAATSSGLLISLILTVPILIIYYPLEKFFIPFFSDLRISKVFSILLLGLVFTCLYAVIRGSFWGKKKFLLTSTLELLEEAVMVIVGICLIQNSNSSFLGAQRAAIAVIISYIFSFFTSLICYFIYKGKITSPKKQIKSLFSSAMPITFVKAGTSLVGSIIAVLLPCMLVRNGASNMEALSLFGVVSGMVIPILSIPSTLIGSISLVLVPELAEDFYKNRSKRVLENISRGISVSYMIACALIPFFFVLGEDLGKVIYSSSLAGEMIQRSSFILLPMSLSMITTGILNSLNYEKRTLNYYFVGATFLILSILFLPKFVGVYAYPIGLFINFFVTALLNTTFLIKTRLLPNLFTKKLIIVSILIFPIIVFGELLFPIIKIYFSSILSLILCACLLMLITFSLYFLFEVFTKRPIAKLFSKK